MIARSICATVVVFGFAVVPDGTPEATLGQELRGEISGNERKVQEAEDETYKGGATATKPPRLSAAADWHLLYFWPDFPDGRRIEKATLSFDQDVVSEKVEISIADRETLRRLELGMYLPFRFAFPDDGTRGGGCGCGGAIGVLKVSATDGDFVIGISRVGFMMNKTEVNNFNNLFFSWRLAKELDEVWFKETERHLPDTLFKYLSGIAWLENQGWKPARGPAPASPTPEEPRTQ